MALFNKLFSTSKKRTAGSSTQKTSSGQFGFTTEQVRVVLFRECDIRGRKLLFDSSAVEKIPDGVSTTSTTSSYSGTHHKTTSSTIPHTQRCEHCKILYQHGTNPKSDIKSLAEMIFGSAPMAFQGSCFKVHWLKTPKALMCSHVFPAPVRSTTSGSSSVKKSLVTTYLGSELPTHHTSYDRQPSGSDLSSIDTSSLRSFTVTSSTSTQHDMSYNHRQRPPLPLEFSHLERSMDPRLSTNSGLDSGYGGTDPWAASSNSSRHPLSSHRSSLASICSDYECFRRLSTDASVDISNAFNYGNLEDCNEYGSFHRRVSKNLSTSFENRLTIADHIGHVDELNVSSTVSFNGQVAASDGCVGSKHRRNSETMEINRRKAFSGELLSTSTNYHARLPNKKARLGIALYIQQNDIMPHEMEAFCSEHMSVFESMLCRLRIAAENASYRWPQLLQIMLTAWHSTQQWLVDFFNAPRLLNPVWISLSNCSGGTYPNKISLTIANNFMNDLCSLLSLADTKDTNLFVSTLLTAVLTHHLGWVSTIAPIGVSAGTENPIDSIQLEKEKLSKITANHPYNVLWAQLGDLYGAIGHPVKLSKTIICGSPQLSNTLEKILNVLSYFVRCSEIKRTVYVEVFDEVKVSEAFSAQRITSDLNSTDMFNEGERRGDFRMPQLTRSGSGMVRSSTRMKDLTAMGKQLDSSSDGDLSKVLRKNVMNDIPNVLAYRDSRFVQQELRIGNKSMDTELLMNARQKQFLEMIYHIKKGKEGKPILTLTQPDELGQEALELNGNDTDDVESVRLSRLITENNIGEGVHGQRLLWGLERFKEGLSMEQLKYIDVLRGDYEVLKHNKPKDDVVFVLGENEELKNIRHTTADEAKDAELGAVGGKKPCCLNRLRKHNVIFNFDRYPKVVENYWKSQNLGQTEFNFLEKGLKLENALKLSSDTETARFPDLSEEECDACRNACLFYLQTPTNASELEFSNELSETSSISFLHESASKSSLEEELRKYPGIQPHENIPKYHSNAMATLEENTELKMKHPDSVLKLVDIPMSKVSALATNDENNNDKTEKPCKFSTKAGFMPSLFSRTTDHYIPDMIMQGITAPRSKWEKALKTDLSFASRFALMEPYPVENLAVLANLDTYDVRIVSSHTSSLVPTCSDGDLVGMSQLVSSMLESVHAMWTAGMSAFQCMAFIESKLRELYLQSETIASFLLATDFCTIGSIISALDITANDMPLLLSVASIHTPEVTKRYGIAFR